MRAVLLRVLLFLEVVLLVVQLFAGTFIFLYPIPNLVNLGFFSYSGTGLGIHHYIAASVLILAVLAMISSFIMKSPLLSKLSISGFLLLIGAFVSGIAFVYLQKSTYYAIAMGTFFILALMVYLSSTFLVKK